MDFKLEQKVKVVVSTKLGETLTEILNLGKSRKPMIVLDRFLLDSPIIKESLSDLENNQIEYFLYTDIVPDPPVHLIDNGAKIFNQEKCDAVIAIGGGSVIDAARGINIVRTLGGSIIDYVSNKEITTFCKGLISVPTTSGTGSELSNALVVTDTEKEEKLAVLSNNAVSEYAILNPELVMTVPKQLTIITGLDVFSHAAEAYTSILSSPVIDAICEKIMFLVVTYLPLAVNEPLNYEARERMMVASALGGWVLNNGGTHIGHSLAHVIGAKMHIPHGMGCAYSLPIAIELTSEVKPKKIKEIGNILGVNWEEEDESKTLGEIVATAYRRFRDEVLGLKPFSELNIKEEELLNLTHTVLNERFIANSPFEVNEEVVKKALMNIG